MKRKIIVLLSSACLLAACSGTNGGGDIDRHTVEFENVEIKFGNPITGADGAYMRQLVKSFNAEYEGKIKVSESYQTEVSFYQSLEMNMPMNLAPDVALVHSYKIASYANKDLLQPLQPALDVGQVEMKDSDFLSSTISGCNYNGTKYAIPLDIHTTLLYYNKTLLDTYGLSVPTNREELLACCDWMGNSNAQGWGLPLSVEWPSEYIFTTALFQNGGTDITPDGYPAFNSDAAKRAMALMNEIIWDYGYSPTKLNVDGDLTLFCQGKAMFHIQGDWQLAEIQKSANTLHFEFGVTSLANMFVEDPSATSNQVYARSHVFCVPKNSSLDNTKEQAILTFIKYMEEHSDVWANSGHVPAYNASRETEAYQALPYHSHFGDLSNYRLNTTSPYYYEGFSPVFARVTECLSNSSYNAQQLLNEAEKEGKDAVDLARSLD